jgi:predicted transcriptional regulator
MYSTTLPPSSKTVMEILDAGGAMTHKDLVQKTHLAPRTVRYALKKLKERHLIIEKFNFRDARQIIYQNRTSQTIKPQPACV